MTLMTMFIQKSKSVYLFTDFDIKLDVFLGIAAWIFLITVKLNIF